MKEDRDTARSKNDCSIHHHADCDLHATKDESLQHLVPCSISFPPAGLVNCGISARYKIAALGFNRLVISPCGTVWPALQPPWGKYPPDRYLAESEPLSPNFLRSIL